MLHYRSKRRGFTTYTAGQLKAVATTYFKTEMGVGVKESEIKFDTVHVSFQVGLISARDKSWLILDVFQYLNIFLAHFRQQDKDGGGLRPC